MRLLYRSAVQCADQNDVHTLRQGKTWHGICNCVAIELQDLMPDRCPHLMCAPAAATSHHVYAFGCASAASKLARFNLWRVQVPCVWCVQAVTSGMRQLTVRL
jgi:hypothetical protein